MPAKWSDSREDGAAAFSYWFQTPKWSDGRGGQYTDAELYAFLAGLKSGIVLLSGPSMCGKSALLKRLQQTYGPKMKIITDEELTDGIRCNMIISKLLQGDALNMGDKKLLAVEDVDFLAGKEDTQESAGYILKILSDNGKLIILTGIKLRQRVPFLIGSVQQDITAEIEYI